LGVSVLDAPRMDKEALDILVDKGSRISFIPGNLVEGGNYGHRCIPKETYFDSQTQFGNKRADRIRVLEQ
jgi:hypothetical protein